MKKELSPPVMIAIIAIVVLLVGIMGWKYMGARRGPNGEDLSRPAVPPSNMSQKFQQVQQEMKQKTNQTASPNATR